MRSRKIQNFKNVILQFYYTNKKNLPWRNTYDPYKIWVSEIMLQQTQIKRVQERYNYFLENYPDVRCLGEARLKDLLHDWQGLGYNRRALNMKTTAQEITEKFNAKIPLSYEALIAFKGIGEYTANAIITFAKNEPRVFIETNIRSVFIHHFFSDKQKVSDEEIFPLIELTLDKRNPKEWYYALMDYGSYIKKCYGNPNKRSKHYYKQTKFKGSKREIRGEIIRRLTKSSKLSLDTLDELRQGFTYNVDQIVTDLEKEGFLIREGESIYMIH